MQIHFYKYQGTGNDFIILDNRSRSYDGLNKDQISFLCDRRFGIGADGLMLLNSHPQHDFEMVYYNADGGESTMCGNGGRCLTKFASDMGMIQTDYTFLAIDGMHEASINTDGSIALKMADVDEVKYDRGHFLLNTGSPHYVTLTSNVMQVDVVKKGRDIRYSAPFKKEGINVNFVEQTEYPDRIIVRTYERGVEDETLSCGTGVTAAALVCHHNDNGFNRVEVGTRGGRLSVEYDRIGDSYKNIWLNGPAVRVFEGKIEL
ncbi:MAG TPA: diaminopimelate epimerase [Flavisolibacter sp.]|nr:diaminopimelate epimerase [Flavisolibacter sp.]